MDTVLPVLVLAATLAAILAGLSWLGQRVRRRGADGDVIGPFEEIWHPAAHRYRAEIRVHEERTVPTPSPGSPDSR